MGKKINLRSVASLLDGFNATYDTIGNVLRDRDLAEIARAKVGEQVEAGVPTEVAGMDGQEGATTMPAPQVKKYTYLGETFDTAPDATQMRTARLMAQAGVLEKYGQPERALALRDAAEASAARAEDRAYLGKVRPLQLKALERADKAASDAEADTALLRDIDKDVGGWFEQRLSDGNGGRRAATIDDHLAAGMYRAGKLLAAGKIEAANKVMQEHQAGALVKIHLETAERNDAVAKASAALANGNLDGVREFYNRFIPDGATVTDVKRGPKGEILIERVTADGRKMPTTTMQDTNQLLAALNTFRDPMELYKWSQGEFLRNMALRADKRAAAAEMRAQDTHEAGAPARELAKTIAGLQAKMLDPTTPDPERQAISGLLQAVNGIKKEPAPAKIESGDITTLLGDPAVDRNGRALTDPMTGRQVVNRNPAREQDFFNFMAAAGLKNTDEALLAYKSMPEFATAQALDAAVKAGQVKRGALVRVGGVTGRAQ